MTVFITGATGYIGGSVAVRLAQQGYHVRGLARSAEKAQQLSSLNIEPVIGNLSNLELLTQETTAADAVINAANADAAEPVRHLISALAGSGKALIHTSGSSIVADEGAGSASKIIHTVVPAHPVPAKAARVAIDREVLRSSESGIRSIVICPTMVYGEGTGPHKQSIQVPLLLRHAINTGVAEYIGEGLNRWSNVHIEDLADLYLLALQQGRPGSFYFAENGEEDLRTIVSRIAQLLHLPLHSLELQEAIALWGREPAEYALASNSRVSAKAARQDLGWNPLHYSLIQDLSREVTNVYAPSR
jgi:nucleoside-diphosphate-sugar epimerase